MARKLLRRAMGDPLLTRKNSPGAQGSPGHKVPRRYCINSTSLRALFPSFRPAKFLMEAVKRREGFLGEIRSAYVQRGIVLYVGAGLSRSLGLPSWPELIRSLSLTMISHRGEDAIATLQKLTEEERWKLLGTLAIQAAKMPDSSRPILMMARAIKDEFGDLLPAAIARVLYRPIRRALSSYFDTALREQGNSTHGRYSIRGNELPSSQLLDAIVCLARAEKDSMGVRAIVNYNYDDLLDVKLREQDVRCRTVLSGTDKLALGTLPCYHVHGLIRSRDFILQGRSVAACGNFVFSEDEYHAEYAQPYKWSNMAQINLLQRYTGVFVGLSMEDPNIRRLIDVTHAQYPDNVSYAFLPRQRRLRGLTDSSESVIRNLSEEIETRSFNTIGLKIVWFDEYEELPALIRRICSDSGQ